MPLFSRHISFIVFGKTHSRGLGSVAAASVFGRSVAKRNSKRKHPKHKKSPGLPELSSPAFRVLPFTFYLLPFAFCLLPSAF
jgi:hypothetical protein